jgi:hypothetical protein
MNNSMQKETTPAKKSECAEAIFASKPLIKRKGQ